MPFDIISPIVFAADWLSVGSSLDAVLTHRPRQKVAFRFPNPRVVRLIAGVCGCLFDDCAFAEATHQKVQRAALSTRRNELVQDRDAGSVWPALASSFLWVNQPCLR